MALTKLISKAAQNAFQKLVISKPGTIPDDRYSRKAFIIKVKRPKLNMFIGRVRKISTGLTKTFNIPKTSEAKTRTFKSSNRIR
jgi:hypothetical protein